MVGDQLTPSKRNVRLLSDSEYSSKELFRADSIIENGMKLSGASEGMNNSKQEQKWAKLLLPLAVAVLATLAILACRGDGDTPEVAATINPGATVTLIPSAAPGATPIPRATREMAPTRLPASTPLPPGDPDLYRAIWAGTPNDVRDQVATGREVNASNESGDPFLYTAIWRADPETVQILADAGADVNARDADGDPLLYTAVWRDRTQALRILVDAGRGRECQRRRRRPPPVHRGLA